MPSEDRPRLVRVAGRTAWHIYDQRARPRRFSVRTDDRAEAERSLADYIAHKAAPGRAARTVATILDAYLADRREHGKAGAERLDWAHRSLKRLLGGRLPDTLIPLDGPRYTRVREAEGVKASTVRTELQALTAALRWANTPETIALPPKAPPRERWLTRAEADALLAATDRRHIKLFMLIALHTAARAGAILALTWDRVDIERRLIDFRVPGAVATRKRRVPVPINDVLAPALAGARRLATTRYVIEWAGVPVASVKHGFRDAATRAKLRDVTPHVLRHTAATWMVQGGVPLWQVAGMLGHSDAVMVAQVYGHHSSDHMRDAAAALAGQQ